MADVIINDEHLHDIADAIRSKNGSEDTYKPREMAAAIESIEGRDPDCNGMHVPESALTFSKTSAYRCAYNSQTWLLNLYGDKVTTSKLGDCSYMFYTANEIEKLPFDFNFANDTYYPATYMFADCSELKEIGKMVNFRPSGIANLFYRCRSLRCLPEFVNPNFSRIQEYASLAQNYAFNGCESLREIPEELLKQLYGNQAYYYSFLQNTFTTCYTLDEIKGLNPQSAAYTTNVFASTFNNCARVKDIIFATQEDGSPYEVSWKSQTINLSQGIGWSVNGATVITRYNSGITADKEVKDDASYQALKDDPDWFTSDFNYARFNKTSAENFINSLPDASEYLATAGGTNTIIFKGTQGSKTDGGAIQDLDESTIALAASKGWTVSLT